MNLGAVTSLLTLMIMLEPTRDDIYQSERQIDVECRLRHSHKIQRVGNKVWNTEGYFVILKAHYRYEFTKPHGLSQAAKS